MSIGGPHEVLPPHDVLGADPDRPDGWEGPYTYEQE